jgi:hypothetical protein
MPWSNWPPPPKPARWSERRRVCVWAHDRLWSRAKQENPLPESGLTDIFTEIEEDMRRDRVASLWRRYGKLVIAAAFLLVIGTALYVFWQNYRQRQDEAAGNRYSQAVALMHGGADAKAFDAFKALSATTSQEGYGLLARIQVAAMQAQGTAGTATPATRKAGLDALDAIAKDSDVRQDYRDIARLQWGLYGVDSLPKASIVEALQPLTIAPNPWRFTATELSALSDLRSGDKRTALTLYKSLADDLDAPQSVRARAAEIVTDLQD